MPKTLQNVAQVALIFFIFFGFLHISASILIAQEIIAKPNWIIFNVLDLPFILAGLVYASAKLSLMFGRITDNYRTPLIICSGVSIVLFLIALYLNFVLPDATIF